MSKTVVRNLALTFLLGAASYAVNANALSPLFGVKCTCNPDPNCT
jgi:hypothetical protein